LWSSSEESVFVFMVQFSFQPRPRTRQTVLAIMSSSFVRMTRTATRQVAVEITAAFAAFSSSLGSMPRNPSPSQIRARTTGAFSPMPPGNTGVSSSLNSALQNPSERVTGLYQRELDARRAAIDRQDAWVSWFHG
jgi:hypothetical protein